MSSPSRYSDGITKAKKQNGPTRFAYPFASHGDTLSFLAIRTMRQDAAAFKAPLLGFENAFDGGPGQLVDVSETRDVGCGLLEWDETFASVPVPRNEYGSVTYTQQFLEIDTLSQQPVSFYEYQTTRDARFHYTYSAGQPLPTVIAPRLIQLPQSKIGSIGGWGQFAPGQEILAQDTESSIYMGRIYQRKAVFINFVPAIPFT